MRLYSYDDEESQAIHLTPSVSAGDLFSPGDTDTQPLWAVLLDTFDACAQITLSQDAEVSIMLGLDACKTLNLSLDAERSVDIAADADVELDVKEDAEAEIEVGADAEVVIDLEEECN